MTDWVADYAWLAWVALAVLLGLVELLSLDLVLTMFAIGALAAALATALGAPIWLALAVFVVVSVALLYFARPSMVARLHAGPDLMTGPAKLVGQGAVVLEPVGSDGGRVRLAGEEWTAHTDDDDILPAGSRVVVTRIDGATAIVRAEES